MRDKAARAESPQALIERHEQAFIIRMYEHELTLVSGFFGELAHHGLAASRVDRVENVEINASHGLRAYYISCVPPGSCHVRILDRYLFKEMLLTWLAVLVVLLVIMTGNVLARSLARVTDGAIDADILLLFVGVKSIGLLVTLIPLALYLGILLAHGRFYRDNEMSVMQACGFGWLDLMRPTVIIGLIAVLLIAVLTVFAAPWAARYEQALKQDMRERSAVSLLTPGRFIESSDGSLVFFVRSADSASDTFRDVFLHRREAGQPSRVDTSASARYRRDDITGDEYIELVDGQTSIGGPGSATWTVTEFRTQSVLRPYEDPEAPRLRTKGKTLSQLIGSDSADDRAELQWRISLPLGALLLAMLAVPLAYTSPRQGRFGKIGLAILVYIPFANLLSLARKWIASGAMPAWIGLWPIHIAMLVLIVLLLARRVGWGWLLREKRR